jgi:LmbE family N-acetylglucosaminyl deacetylase
MLIDPPAPASVLVVVAHPDDAEFSAGGTIARWTSNGTRAALCICTNGDKGSDDPGISSAELARLREQEERAAASVLGIDEVIFLGHPDGTLQPTLELRRDIVRVIRQVRPEAVICPDPLRRYGATYVNHPDHRAVGEAALDAIYPSARDPLVFPELARAGLEPHKVVRVFVSNPLDPSCLVDIGETLERKIDALRQHRSQVSEDRLREFLPKRAAEVGAPAGLAYAEGFQLITLS